MQSWWDLFQNSTIFLLSFLVTLFAAISDSGPLGISLCRLVIGEFETNERHVERLQRGQEVHHFLKCLKLHKLLALYANQVKFDRSTIAETGLDFSRAASMVRWIVILLVLHLIAKFGPLKHDHPWKISDLSSSWILTSPDPKFSYSSHTSSSL